MTSIQRGYDDAGKPCHRLDGRPVRDGDYIEHELAEGYWRCGRAYWRDGLLYIVNGQGMSQVSTGGIFKWSEDAK